MPSAAGSIIDAVDHYAGVAGLSGEDEPAPRLGTDDPALQRALPAVLGNRRLTDLEDLAVWSAAEHQADFVLINPLQAAEPVPPIEPSPTYPAAAALPTLSICDSNASRSTPWPPRRSEEIDKIRIRLLDETGQSSLRSTGIELGMPSAGPSRSSIR